MLKNMLYYFRGDNMAIKNNYIIEKSNVLSEMRDANMSLQELRFFSIYLAKINARDISTRRVRFPLSDFQKIMGFGRLNIKQLQTSTNRLLCKVINIPNSDGGYTGFTIFKRVCVFKNNEEKWCVEIDASDDALPLLFNLKSNYFKYELWNALRLKSVNQLRIYEMLKRYEKVAVFEIKVSELRERLYIKQNQYLALKDFKKYVLDSCQQALEENTDICYTYECGKRGNHGKWLTIIFRISKNTKYKNPLQLEDFIKIQPENEMLLEQGEQKQEEITHSVKPKNKRQPYVKGLMDEDLTQEEIEILCDLLSYKVQKESERTQDKLKERLRVLYSTMLANSLEPVRNAYAYLKKIIININPDKLPPLQTKNKTFDIDKYKIFVNDF